MYSNRAIVDSLECYMDDLVETFEDFVKKSLMVISFGIGAIVVILGYLLKTVSERQDLRLHNVINENAARVQNEMRNMIVKNDLDTVHPDILTKERNVQDKGFSVDSGTIREKITATVNTTLKPSYDEQILRDIGLSSCSKTVCKSQGSNHNKKPTRVPIPIFSTPKHKSIHSLRPSKQNISASQSYQRTLEKQGTCCSMCCNNKPSAK